MQSQGPAAFTVYAQYQAVRRAVRARARRRWQRVLRVITLIPYWAWEARNRSVLSDMNRRNYTYRGFLEDGPEDLEVVPHWLNHHWRWPDSD